MLTIWSLDDARAIYFHSPGLATALGNLLPIDTPVLDLGCSRGSYLAYLAGLGYRCCGVEGTRGISEIAEFAPIVEADLSQPLALDWPRSSVICLEVGEHLAPESEGQLLENIDRYCESWLILSWAIPGQPGHGHNNCRPNTYIYDQVTRRGFDFQPRDTFVLRDAADDQTPWFKNTLFVFRRRDGGS